MVRGELLDNSLGLTYFVGDVETLEKGQGLGERGLGLWRAALCEVDFAEGAPGKG